MNPSQQISDKHYETQPRLDLGGTYCNQGVAPLSAALWPSFCTSTRIAEEDCPRRGKNDLSSPHNTPIAMPISLHDRLSRSPVSLPPARRTREQNGSNGEKEDAAGAFYVLAKRQAGWLGITRRSRDTAGSTLDTPHQHKPAYLATWT